MLMRIAAVAATLPLLVSADGPAITTTEGGIAREEKGKGERLAEAVRYAEAHKDEAKEFSTSPGHDLANAVRYVDSHPRQVKTARDYVENHGLSAHDLANIKRYGEAHLLNAQEMAEITKHNNKGSVLGPHDIVGTTFFIACNMMLAFTAFFFVQVGVVPQKWRTSVSIAGLVTGVAFYNYTFMKQQWVELQVSPTNYRYTDWLITVPLQIAEFYFILTGAGLKVPASLGLRLFSASLAMVMFGWLAEIDVMQKVVGFALGCSGWLYIVYETFAGEAAAYAAKLQKQSSRDAFNYVRLIVSIGWTIYPLGFAIAYIIPGNTIRPDGEGPPYNPLNVLYNLADLVNKGAFGLAIWSAAISDTDKAEPLLG
jgi:bacteriorhodopsin